MGYYPVFLDLRGKECLVVGAGSVGRRKVSSLCKCLPKKILVVDPNISRDFTEDMPDFVEIKNREFKETDLDGKFLVIVATNDLEKNKKISKLCNEKNILCNVVDVPSLCSFIVPACISRGSIKIAISTEGKSPAVSKYIKNKLINSISDEIVILTEILGKIRPYVIGLGKSSDENKIIFNSLIEDDFLMAIKNRDKSYITLRIREILSSLSEEDIQELLNDIF